MKRLILSWQIFCILLLFGMNNVIQAQEKEQEMINKVEALLAKMTLEEKVGQMTQVTLEAVSSSRGSVTSQHQLDLQKLEDAIVKYQVGSILNVWDVAHSVDYWHEVITRIQDLATKKTRLGIPILYGIDAIHGANYTLGATLFPQSLGMAATWNTELVKKNGEITAYEVRASGIPWNFNPVLGVGRNPLWPRLFETYGEDPYTVAVMGSAYIKGLQGDPANLSAPDKVAACMKHYLGYSVPLSGHDRTPAWIPERMLREIFLPPFQAAVNAGCQTVMVNSSEINGIPVHADPYILTEILRKELAFNGLVVSDWHDIINLFEREKVADSNKEAVRLAVLAGIDMSMVPYDLSFYNYLLELVREGTVPLARIDEAVRRILTVKYQLGLFDDPYPDKKLKAKFASPEFAQVNLQAARESLTLLKNEKNVLPLAKDQKVLITGPTANLLSVMNSGWTITWQGNEESLYPQEKNTILEAVQAKLGKDKVIYQAGAAYDKEVDIAATVSAAKNAAALIICLGEMPYCETPGNIDDLNLPEVQLNLVDALLKTGKPTILVLVEGRPRLITRIAERVDAILMAYLPGLEGGNAIADVLFGDFNPCGKLPITYPRHTNALQCYDYKYSEITPPNSYNPQFPFGCGLSYTSYEYSDLYLDKKELNKNQQLTVRVTVHNIGKRAGKEVVHLFVSDLVRSITPPVQQLKGFQGIYLQPGESRTIEFILKGEDLGFIGRDNKRIIEPGEFKITIGKLSDKFILL
jgi:beta-glucosidase